MTNQSTIGQVQRWQGPESIVIHLCVLSKMELAKQSAAVTTQLLCGTAMETGYDLIDERLGIRRKKVLTDACRRSREDMRLC